MLVSPGRAATPITACASCGVNDNSVRCDPKQVPSLVAMRTIPVYICVPAGLLTAPPLHSQKCVLFHTKKLVTSGCLSTLSFLLIQYFPLGHPVFPTEMQMGGGGPASFTRIHLTSFRAWCLARPAKLNQM